MPRDVAGETELTIELDGIKAPHKVLVCRGLPQQVLIGIDFLIAHKCIINFDNNTAYSKGGPSKMVFVLIENVYRISIAETVKYHQIWLLIYLARLKGFAAWSFLSVWLHHEVSKVFRWGRTKCKNCKRWSNTNSCMLVLLFVYC